MIIYQLSKLQYSCQSGANWPVFCHLRQVYKKTIKCFGWVLLNSLETEDSKHKGWMQRLFSRCLVFFSQSVSILVSRAPAREGSISVPGCLPELALTTSKTLYVWCVIASLHRYWKQRVRRQYFLLNLVTKCCRSCYFKRLILGF